MSFRAAIVILAASLASLPALADPGKHSVFVDFAASMTPAIATGPAAGFALCYQFDPIRYLPMGVVFTYAAPMVVNDKGLEYRLRSLEGAVYAGARLAFDWVPGESSTGFWGVLRKILMANEIQAGPIFGMTHYIQEVRAEEVREARHAFAGVFLTYDVWFREWFGVRHSVVFHWSLTRPVKGQGTLMRTEFVWGPAFRF
jgi:hypothetical protein